MSISIMKRLEELSGRRIYELFDYVCGVSTGSLIGAMAAIYRVPIAEMEEIYKEFSVQMFEQNRFVGAGKLITAHAYYDTELWETILRYFSFIILSKIIILVSFCGYTQLNSYWILCSLLCIIIFFINWCCYILI